MKQPEDIVVDDNIVVLFSRKSILEVNETNEMETYLPDYLLIGNDSGDMVFVLELKEQSPIWQVDAGSLRIEDFEEISSSFTAWKDSKFILPAEPDYHLPLHADIYVNHVKNLKTMFELKKLLAQNWGASHLKALLQEQPFLVIKSGPPIALESKLRKNPVLKPFLFYKNGDILEQICS